MSQRSTAIRVGVVALLLLLPTYAGQPALSYVGRPGLGAGETSPQTRPGPESRVIDPAAVAILQAMDDAFASAQGLVASYRMEAFRPTRQPSQTETLELRLGRPNMYELRWVNGTAPPTRILASNGKNRYSVMTSRSMPRGSSTPVTTVRCLVSDVAPLNDAREIDTFNPVYWSFYNLGEWQIRSALLGHWSTKWRLGDPGTRAVKYIGRGKLGDLPVDEVEWTYTIGYNYADDDPVYTSRLSIGLDHFVRKIETTSTSKKEYEGRRIVETVSDIKTTALQPASAFAYTPPDGTTCQPYDQEAVYTTGQYTDLPIGSKAPDFTLKTARGETLRFSEFLKQHKVVLMNYWGYG
jgi:outer membrane lipoprotein-sorting protein